MYLHWIVSSRVHEEHFDSKGVVWMVLCNEFGKHHHAHVFGLKIQVFCNLRIVQ